MTRNGITQQTLKELIEYNPQSGVFTWLPRERNTPGWTNALTGKEAGHVNKAGYRVIVVKGRAYKAHRLAWLYIYGSWPNKVIDHIDGNPINNRISNLRDVTNTINMQNQRRPNGVTKSGLLGVKWRSDRSKWVAEIYIDGRPKRIGSFVDKYAAHAAYLEAKRRYHEGCSI